ncbi:MAG: transposase [Candidatus Latescibacteria bacterium]|nr:transposase [Candidatus Latescibacterota bacterium]
MDDQIITIYIFCHEWLQALDRREESQGRVTDAEIMTMALVSAGYFGGNFETGRQVRQVGGYMPEILSRSRFNRRLHRLDRRRLQLQALLGQVWIQLQGAGAYVLDSFPLPACDTIRMQRSRLYREKTYRGYCPSKRRYFHGLKLHLLVTGQGQPVEFFLSPGCTGDVQALEWWTFDRPPGSIVYPHSAYTHYAIEDLLEEALQITLQPARKKNATRPVSPCCGLCPGAPPKADRAHRQWAGAALTPPHSCHHAAGL